jgi:signal transduction histidine kinase/ActR/RegA family two-component response regulator/HPt (histidine-containing phosphotransfer) domain-containing protein
VAAYFVLVVLVAFGAKGSSTRLCVTAIAVASVIAAIRLTIAQAILHDRVSLARGRRAFIAATLLTAASWALFALSILAGRGSAEAAGDQLVVLIPTAGIAASASTSLAAEKGLVRAYLAILLGPVVCALVWSGDRQSITAAFSGAMFAALLTTQAKQFYDELVERADTAVLLARRADELLLAQRAAEAASVTKSEFLANMSHELRTPMTAVMGYAELLLAPEVSPSDRLSHAQTIRRNAGQLLALLSDILDLSKIEAGKMTVERRPCNPRSILADLEATMRPLATARGLELRIQGVEALPSSAETDRTRLRQVLINLVSNAVKFTAEGSVTVTASSVPCGVATRLRFEVTDTGIGISDEQASRLFTPFGQADASTTRRFGGTGLGLIISRTFARLLGGDIVLASVPGEGTTFTVEIDAGNTSESAIDDTSVARKVSPNRRVRLDGMKLLVADDCTDNQRLLRAFLTAAGGQVDLAENGRVAVTMALAARASGAPYDLVFMDMQMPELDGLGAVAELRHASYTGKIVALTAHAMVGDRERYLSAGCDDYVTKPVTRETLLWAASVHRAVEAPGAEDAAPLPSPIGLTPSAPIVRSVPPAQLTPIVRSVPPAQLTPIVRSVPPAQLTPSVRPVPLTRSARPAPLVRSVRPPVPSAPLGASGASRRRHPPLVSELSDDPVLASVVQTFVDRLDQRIAELAGALERADLEALQTHAHSLAGSGGTVGFPTITDTARALEVCLRTGGEATAAAPLLAALVVQCRRAIAGAPKAGERAA